MSTKPTPMAPCIVVAGLLLVALFCALSLLVPALVDLAAYLFGSA
ncbi:hypothetical protein [Amycolatopsis sp. YIM 10]|nr:hypothetical protein [Amycolatopsis sp. YIM 10]QFU87846.1 hypothetical protein YIM_13300 [Amycolatopsis sp. YIM 10]QFU94841.1 hypothetical protein YIM_48580 [Amycolatopsis sp. YIM 10]